ncbi:MAG TPA: hypothetical protein VGD60_15225 [Candidatus Acidoferrales bacterium]
MRSIVPQTRVFWIGLTIYLLSFIIPAVDGEIVQSGPAFGFYCAFYSLFLAPGEILQMAHGDASIMTPLGAFSLMASGLINVVFLISTGICLFSRVRRSLQIVLKCFVVALFPFCWIVFREENLHPLWGYFLWAIGMLMVVFFEKSATSETVGRLSDNFESS